MYVYELRMYNIVTLLGYYLIDVSKFTWTGPLILRSQDKNGGFFLPLK